MRPRIGFLLAGATAAFTAWRHIAEGTGAIGLPILHDESLGQTARWMGYYVWHMISATVVLMSLGFIWAALRTEARPAGQLLTVLAALFAGLASWIGLAAHFALLKLFPLQAFTVITLAGAWSSVRR